MSKLPLKCKQLNIQVLKFKENLINQFSAAILLKNTTKPFSQTKDIHWCYHQLHQTSGVSLASCLTSYIRRLGSQRKRLQYSFLARKQFVRSPKHWHLIYFGWFWEKTNESGSCRFLSLAQSSPIKVLAQTKEEKARKTRETRGNIGTHYWWLVVPPIGIRIRLLICSTFPQNITRSTTDPGYWLFNLSYLSS